MQNLGNEPVIHYKSTSTNVLLAFFLTGGPRFLAVV